MSALGLLRGASSGSMEAAFHRSSRISELWGSIKPLPLMSSSLPSDWSEQESCWPVRRRSEGVGQSIAFDPSCQGAQGAFGQSRVPKPLCCLDALISFPQFSLSLPDDSLQQNFATHTCQSI